MKVYLEVKGPQGSGKSQLVRSFLSMLKSVYGPGPKFKIHHTKIEERKGIEILEMSVEMISPEQAQ